jgi:hypothetical protein
MPSDWIETELTYLDWRSNRKGGVYYAESHEVSELTSDLFSMLSSSSKIEYLKSDWNYTYPRPVTLIVMFDVYGPNSSALAILPHIHIVNQPLESRIAAMVSWHRGRFVPDQLPGWEEEGVIEKGWRFLRHTYVDHLPLWQFATGKRPDGAKTTERLRWEEYWLSQTKGEENEKAAEVKN